MHRQIFYLPAIVHRLALFVGLMCMAPAWAAPPTLPELKVAFLENFLVFTDWPSDVGPVLNVCLYGKDPLTQAMGALHGKTVNTRTLAVQTRNQGDALLNCQLVYLANPATLDGMQALAKLHGLPALTVAATANAAYLGVALNLLDRGNEVTCEINLPAVRAARIQLSSKLLHLSTKVIQ